jgi:superfamily II DNA or RNA helicase
MNRKIILRPYQEKASNYILQSEKCVLALCPGGGKTEISINVIDEYLKLFPENKVLVLTHSTNVLLNNYLDRLNSVDVPFSYSDDLKTNSSVHVCIPANEHKIKGEYDFLIVDEAHENYLADRVQKIISKTKPTKQLLLTATPSKFIYEGNYDIFAIALDELDDNYFAKLNIELVASNYTWTEKDYNQYEEVKNSFKYTLEDTNKTVESVVLSLLNRLDSGLSAEQFNDPSLLTKMKLFFKKKTVELSPWSSTFKKVGKTLIVCNNIEQSDLVYSVLKENDVNVGISHSKCDVNGLNISTFKDNDFDVLVVVDRCRIGYDDAMMMNLIDMSGTHNIDLIYQMMCRVIRGDQSMVKYYIKVTTNELAKMAADEISVNGALMLSNREFLLKYNGKNFNDLEIPVLKTARTIEVSGGSSKTGESSHRRTRSSILPEIIHDVFSLLKDIKHNLANPTSIYKITTISDVKKDLGLKIKHVPKSYEEILALARTIETVE